MIFKFFIAVVLVNIVLSEIEDYDSNQYWIPQNTLSDLSHTMEHDSSANSNIWIDENNSSSEFSQSSESNDISVFKSRAIALKAFETSPIPPETTTILTTTTPAPENITRLYKHIVQIKRKNTHFVIGIIIHRQWILTTAREFYNIRESINEIKVYTNPEKAKCKPIAVINYIMHPKYEINASNYDIALIRLSRPIENAKERILKLHDWRCGVDDRPVFTVYWPNLTERLYLYFQRRSRMSPMDVFFRRTVSGKPVHQITSDDCKEIIGPQVELDYSTLCFKPIRSGLAECTIDAGAPVIYNDKLWGVTSGWQHEGCQNKHMATLVTDVSLNVTRSWIKTTIKDFKNQKLPST